MALNPSLAFVALLLCFSFSVNPQLYKYPTASAPETWTNTFTLPHNIIFSGREIVRSILRLNTSHGMSFATGLHYPPQVIWSANRARPVNENATLQLTSTNGLTLRESDGSLVWSTSGLNHSMAGINITEAGNLVLFDINNSTIWQSFDHPTDCLVMGQMLKGGMSLIANSSSTSLAESQFFLTLLIDYIDTIEIIANLYGFVSSIPPLVYYSISEGYHVDFYISNGTVDKSIFVKFINGSLTMFSTLPNTDKGS